MDERTELVRTLFERGVKAVHGYPIDGQSLATLQETERATRLPDPPAPAAAPPKRDRGALRWWHWALALVAVAVSLGVGLALQGVGL